MFTKQWQDNSPPISLNVVNQASMVDLWHRGNKLYHALKVVVLQAEIRDWLEQNDPQALKQALAAIEFADHA